MLTSALMVMWGILFAFGAANVAATEKPKPNVKESDELDNVLTGVKVVNGMATNLAGFSQFLMDIEASNSGIGPSVTTGSKVLQSTLLTAGLSKVVGDGAGDKSAVGQVAGIIGDAGDATGKIFDTTRGAR
ncbi:hypothetical protein [Geobacillus sp. B4113_201601]|uniref:hypothetical protein n=1 Tax=Geobacillus sp. B4113_201601 TaxID=1586290 RepID=UPI00128FE30F|nr:hypothetical protein [Geobacillus sp. B4113_201601]